MAIASWCSWNSNGKQNAEVKKFAADEAHSDIGIMKHLVAFKPKEVRRFQADDDGFTMTQSHSDSKLKRYLEGFNVAKDHFGPRVRRGSLGERSASLKIEEEGLLPGSSAPKFSLPTESLISSNEFVSQQSPPRFRILAPSISEGTPKKSEMNHSPTTCVCERHTTLGLSASTPRQRPSQNGLAILPPSRENLVRGDRGGSFGNLHTSNSTPNLKSDETPLTNTIDFKDVAVPNTGSRPNQRPVRLRTSSSRRICKRLVHKDGDCNVSHGNVPKQNRKYLSDIFTTLIDVKWRWGLFIFAGAFLISWTIFASIYYLISLFHGDLEEFKPNNSPCIMRIGGFSSAFLFSVETQHTIGYGYRFVTEDCPIAMVTMCVQCIVGIMIQAFMTGFVFAKLARPKKRAETLIFSKHAVICQQDGKLCFMFRVGDMRKSHIVEAHVRLQMIKTRLTKEGELLPFHQFDMNVGYEQGLDRIFLVWPITICHIIDENSPLYEYSKVGLENAHFEIVAILEGVVESTGMTTQARTSYLPSEILWGHRFEKLVTYQRDNGEYKIDFARFHIVHAVETPAKSVMELEQLEEESSTLYLGEDAVPGLRCIHKESTCSGSYLEESNHREVLPCLKWTDETRSGGT